MIILVSIRMNKMVNSILISGNCWNWGEKSSLLIVYKNSRIK